MSKQTKLAPLMFAFLTVALPGGGQADASQSLDVGSQECDGNGNGKSWSLTLLDGTYNLTLVSSAGTQQFSGATQYYAEPAPELSKYVLYDADQTSVGVVLFHLGQSDQTLTWQNEDPVGLQCAH